MPKSKKVAKRPQKPAGKPARPRAHPAPARVAKASKPAKPSKPAPSKSAAKPAAKAVKPVKAAKAPRLVIPVIVPAAPAAQAPGKFRREYRKWKDILISLRHRLLREGSHLEEEGLKALEQEVSVDHMADFGSDSSEQETTLQLIEVNSLSMRDVDDALKRIDAGSYGLCEECEVLVPPARLEVLPHARFCIACQSKREGIPS